MHIITVVCLCQLPFNVSRLEKVCLKPADIYKDNLACTVAKQPSISKTKVC